MSQPNATDPHPTAPAGRGYARPGTVRRSLRRGRWIKMLVSLFLIGLLVWFLLPAFSRTHHDPRATCAGNVWQIGQAIFMYANENRGRLPDTLEVVLLTQDVNPENFVCRSIGDTEAPGRDINAKARNLTAGGHLSYVYLGRGLTFTLPLDRRIVVLYEPPTHHHGGEGMHVAFVDGRTEFVGGRGVRQILDQATAGHRPVFYPPPPRLLPGPTPGTGAAGGR